MCAPLSKERLCKTTVGPLTAGTERSDAGIPMDKMSDPRFDHESGEHYVTRTEEGMPGCLHVGGQREMLDKSNGNER